jgi:hypothetical protein
MPSSSDEQVVLDAQRYRWLRDRIVYLQIDRKDKTKPVLRLEVDLHYIPPWRNDTQSIDDYFNSFMKDPIDVY